MEYKGLGSSGLMISNQGLGCMGMSEFYGNSNDDESKKIINTAIQYGINFFDTADVYGFGHNEKLVGSVIANHPKRDDLIIATKCGIVRDKNDVRKRAINNRYDYIMKCCHNSCERLTTHIDLFYLHRVDPLGVFDAMKAMAALLAQKKITAVGLSEVSVEIIKTANDTLQELTNGQHCISAIQSEFSILSRDVEKNGVLEFCNANNITFVAYSPISRGLLTSQLHDIEQLEKRDSRHYLPRFVGDNFSKNKIIVDTILAPIAQKNACTIPQLCLAWLMKRTGHVVPIPGTRRLNYLIENINATKLSLCEQDYNLLNKSLESAIVYGQRYPIEDMQVYQLK